MATTTVRPVTAVMPVPEAEPSGVRRPLRVAALMVIPYLLIGIVWAMTNPPGASPDESDHLIKAIAAGRLQIGDAYEGPVSDVPILRRNQSISRVVEIPARLAPDGFGCTAFKPDQSADCQPDTATDHGTVQRTTAVGAYPIFGYIPLGLAARLADSPEGAFRAARLASLLMSMAFFLAGVWHLIRWLGRWAGLGLAIAVTPMAVFASASVSTSGLEIMSSVALASVAVVATRRPSSLADGRTLALVAVGASSLVLSRQLGVITLAILGTLALVRGGAPVVWGQLRRARAGALICGLTVLSSLLVLVYWERQYDHPTGTGTPFSAGAVRSFLDLSYHFLHSGVGVFGWLDTPLPGVAMATWVVVASLVLGVAVILGNKADRWSLATLLAVTVVVAYVMQAVVFYPIEAGLQGRHMIPLFVVAPLLAGVIVVEKLEEVGMPDATRRLFFVVGTSTATLHWLGVLVNSRRNAVGMNGPIAFYRHAEWTPPLGWMPWLLLVTVSSAWLAIVTIRSWPTDIDGLRRRGAKDVER